MKRAVVLLLALGSCKYVPGTGAHEIADAQAAVRYQLDDPASGNFRNERIVGPIGKGYVCGEVNAKNRMGAYVGFRSFAYFSPTKKVDILEDSDGTLAGNLAVLDFPSLCRSAS